MYKIRYADIPAGKIINYLEFLRKTSKNPTDFTIDLEKSILKEGIRNPIIISAVLFKGADDKFAFFGSQFQRKIKLKKHYFKNLLKNQPYFICHYQGCSRLWVAQKHRMMIPCIVCDFCNLEKFHTCRDSVCIQSHFKDKISIAPYNNIGIRCSPIKSDMLN